MGPTMGHAMGGVMCDGSCSGWGHDSCVLRIITWVGSCVRGSLHGWGHVWGHPSDSGATHAGKGCICSKLFVRQGFCGWPGRIKPNQALMSMLFRDFFGCFCRKILPKRCLALSGGTLGFLGDGGVPTLFLWVQGFVLQNWSPNFKAATLQKCRVGFWYF